MRRWWKAEDDVVHNVEDTRKQEEALRAQKEVAVEADLKAREEVLVQLLPSNKVPLTHSLKLIGPVCGE